MEYRREIKRIKPDVVILFLHLQDVFIWPLIHWLKLVGIPIVVWTKGINLEKSSDRLRYQFFNYIHTIADRLVLYSANEMKHIRERNRRKVFVANNTLNFDDFPEISESNAEIKAELGIPFEKVVLSVGRMGVRGQRKKVEHLVEVFRTLEFPGAGLVIVGSGVNDELISMTNRENTMYLGEVHDPKNVKISKLFKIADVFSIPGQLGLGLNQAMFWGVPVVTEAGFQPPEIQYLVDGRNGYIVPEDDIEALKAKIHFLLQNEEIRRTLGANARNDILRNGSPAGMFAGFMDCIESLNLDDRE